MLGVWPVETIGFPLTMAVCAAVCAAAGACLVIALTACDRRGDRRTAAGGPIPPPSEDAEYVGLMG